MDAAEHGRILAIIGQKDSLPLNLPEHRTALLVIDMQRSFVRRGENFTALLDRLAPGAADGYFERVETRVVPNVARLLAAFRHAGLPIKFTGTGTEDGSGMDLAPWLRGFDELGRAVLGEAVWPQVDAPAWQIDPSVAPQPGEEVLLKRTADPFISTALDAQLRGIGVTTVVVVGLTSDVCVSATARAAADRGYMAVVVEDACTTLSEPMHRASLEAIALAFGRVKSTAEIVKLLPAAPSTEAKPTLPA